MNNVLVKHSWDRDHRIDWDEAKILYKSNEIGNRRLVEGAVINLGFSMEGNKSFTQEDNFINRLVCSTVLRDFNYKDEGSRAIPDAVAVSSSPSQVTGLHIAPLVAGVDAVAEEPQTTICSGNDSHTRRRSRRIAGLPRENEGIT